MDIETYKQLLYTRYPNFAEFKKYVEGILQKRTQVKADASRLGANPKEAGVLLTLAIPLVSTNGIRERTFIDDIHVILEKRSNKLKSHPGDIAFPGGRVEDQDTDIIQTAYREAQEELGIEPEYLTYISMMDEFISTSQVLVRPVISWMVLDRDPETFTDYLKSAYYPRTGESSDSLAVPLSHLLNPDTYSSSYFQHVNWTGFVRYFSVDPYMEADHIWGLTASMLRRFIDIVFPDNPLPDEHLE